MYSGELHTGVVHSRMQSTLSRFTDSGDRGHRILDDTNVQDQPRPTNSLDGVQMLVTGQNGLRI